MNLSSYRCSSHVSFGTKGLGQVEIFVGPQPSIKNTLQNLKKKIFFENRTQNKYFSTGTAGVLVKIFMYEYVRSQYMVDATKFTSKPFVKVKDRFVKVKVTCDSLRATVVLMHD